MRTYVAGTVCAVLSWESPAWRRRVSSSAPVFCENPGIQCRHESGVRHPEHRDRAGHRERLADHAMRTLFVATACAGVLALSSVSQAAQISSPTIYGTFDQVVAECSVVNGGPTPLPAVTVKIVSEFGETIGPMNCGSNRTLGAGEFCSLIAQIDNSTAYACVATAGSLANFRGALVFHKHVQDDLGILVLHPIRLAPLR
jgi:hypothetical protein